MATIINKESNSINTYRKLIKPNYINNIGKPIYPARLNDKNDYDPDNL